ncbi:uncharacterized protein CANTADRAFT_20398 [Suhomyces tanzawaensis NRRL Y-17324]|uniref:GSKIP domain-containing protein n=1 Tax=Suhomyces tanzawaensis NRRL Y-17324 TaxID=984487 RepID=A0A1E4SN36_9ASCO|nr:uncharacterized protein CANTADRAFT_20398 [Suhomyces tanzawaensis NRRL Y-17324]ODV80837.1 hypothetical protein CANTADRAFT_20398 [Suhomyces tanzawaensis NRRL Y-17324]
MDNAAQRNELSLVLEEYGSFFPECNLQTVVQRPVDFYNPSKKPQNHLHILTALGDEFKVTVDIRGWSLLTDTRCYETFESLMMNVSPDFQAHFGNELSAKLEKLLQK